MATAAQTQAAKKNIKKAQAVWQNMSARAHAGAQQRNIKKAQAARWGG